ncbi:hypothetical protein [Microcoleus sp. A006_D1]|uniref:hypothetical protein n=1 Tax=Microcoleus sp. A006_D1 TaxID=3055267 RepID=UPI002FD184B4
MLVNRMSFGLELASDFKKSGNAVLLVNSQRQIAGVSPSLVKIWHLPEVVFRAMSEELVVNVVSEQFGNPQVFLREMAEIYANQELELHEIIQLRDGRHIERHSKPLWTNGIYAGRMWVFKLTE